MQKTIGGDRLGAGNKMKAYLHNYERSSHNLSYVWRSTMASGTLVPCLTELALPGDTFDIDLHLNCLTHPTIGPLFGTYKIQVDLFQIPFRLYQAALHMNMLNIGRDMSKIYLPQVRLAANGWDGSQPIDNQQINSSCIFSYLNIRGLGFSKTSVNGTVVRDFNAIPWLGYWDIYKNYYANKQEGEGAVIHRPVSPFNTNFSGAIMRDTALGNITLPTTNDPAFSIIATADNDSSMQITSPSLSPLFDPTRIKILYKLDEVGAVPQEADGTQFFEQWDWNIDTGYILGTVPKLRIKNISLAYGHVYYDNSLYPDQITPPVIQRFPLSYLDDTRINILQYPMSQPFVLEEGSAYTLPPFRSALESYTGASTDYSKRYAQEGLAIKTYNSDLFNNWIDTEWIDGVDGISAITKVDTTSGGFTIDELNMSKKVYNLLNRIAISGGSYDDWLDAAYTEDRIKQAESPIYLGGMQQNLVFQEVISNSATPGSPLGTLAGRGQIGNHKKGGKVVVKVNEPSYIMGIVSLTPIIDYSQGNKYDTNLKNMNELHKPALDEIGFQDLVTDQMAWFDTAVDMSTAPTTPEYRSAGKQPAWINYMTNVNQVRGNFADINQQMFMTLNRRYDLAYDGLQTVSIKDLTTYIDPVKFNHIFAETRRDAQNFWMQIAFNIEARRKMSAKIMPNL